MKTWYLLLDLAVISVFAVWRSTVMKTSFERKPFARRTIHFRVVGNFWKSHHPASGESRKYSQVFGLPKPIPLGIPRPILRRQFNGKCFYICCSILYHFHIWAPTVALLIPSTVRWSSENEKKFTVLSRLWLSWRQCSGQNILLTELIKQHQGLLGW